MNLLSKLSSSTKAKTIEPREIFMTLPSKAPGYGYPRDVQSEVWKKWFDIRNEKNVILKMNTGSGKTVVGLIMLQSCLNEEKGPAIYVVPDNYLVKQVIDEAKRLGISATEDKDDYSYSNSKAILVTSKLATTSSTGGLLLALQRAIVTARPKGRYRKHFCWPAIKRYYSNLLVSILLLALLYTFELLHLLYCQSFQHNIL